MNNRDAASYWSKVAPKYDRIVKRDVPVYTSMVDMLLPHLTMECRVLDIPAGTGILSFMLSGLVKDVVGGDISPAMVEIAKRKARKEGIDNCSFSVMDIYNLPCREESFDVIVAAHVLHLLDDPGEALSRLKRFLKPGGVMLLPVYCHGATSFSLAMSRLAGLAGFQVRQRWSINGYTDYLVSQGFPPGKTRCMRAFFLYLHLWWFPVMRHESLEKVLLFGDRKISIHDLVDVVVTILDARDPYTYAHSWRVAAMCELIADQLDMPGEWKEVLHIAAHLHDIGKVGVPDSVLNKEGPLSDTEYEQVKMHPEIGYTIIKRLPLLEDLSFYIRYHHERWDGRGYPCCLKGKSIPLGARIIAVADTFDAITTSRPYRRAESVDRAFLEIESVRGTQLCPEVCVAFLSIRDEIEVFLNTCGKEKGGHS